VTGGTFLLIVYNFATKFYVFCVGISKVLIPKQKCTHSFIFKTLNTLDFKTQRKNIEQCWLSLLFYVKYFCIYMQLLPSSVLYLQEFAREFVVFVSVCIFFSSVFPALDSLLTPSHCSSGVFYFLSSLLVLLPFFIQKASSLYRII
jgi:hypothetical protein